MEGDLELSDERVKNLAARLIERAEAAEWAAQEVSNFRPGRHYSMGRASAFWDAAMFLISEFGPPNPHRREDGRY